MEFLPLDKYSVNKKNKKSLKGVKRKIQTNVNELSKKSRKYEVKKSFRSESDDDGDVDAENKSVEENLLEPILQKTKKISEDKTNEKTHIPELFVNMKRVIMNEEEVRDIHPDIISVRFPRKKRSRWCWAVFGSKEKAEEALNKLKKRCDIIVQKPRSQLKESLKNTKSSNSKLKRSMKSKIRSAWI